MSKKISIASCIGFASVVSFLLSVNMARSQHYGAQKQTIYGKVSRQFSNSSYTIPAGDIKIIIIPFKNRDVRLDICHNTYYPEGAKIFYTDHDGAYYFFGMNKGTVYKIIICDKKNKAYQFSISPNMNDVVKVPEQTIGM